MKRIALQAKCQLPLGGEYGASLCVAVFSMDIDYVGEAAKVVSTLDLDHGRRSAEDL